MSAPLGSTPCAPPIESLQAAFLALVARIELHGRIYFRNVKSPEKKEEMIAEMVAMAWPAYVRLVRRGKDPARFPAAFASFMARAVAGGRRLAGMVKAKDVMSPVAQRRHGFGVEHLPISTATSHETLYGAVLGQHLHDAFEERLADNTRTPVPDQAAFRIDFPTWYATLTERDRRMVDDLISGERPGDVARRFGLCQGRISQKRREFHEDWQRFHCENDHFSGEHVTALA